MDWFDGNSTHWFSHEKYVIQIGFRTVTAMTAMGAQPLKFPEPCHFHMFKELPFGYQTLPMGIPNINGALVYENHWYLIHPVPAKLHHTESPRMLKSSNPSATFKWHKIWPCFSCFSWGNWGKPDDEAILGCLPDVKTHFWDRFRHGHRDSFFFRVTGSKHAANHWGFHHPICRRTVVV